ncbi:hypothetical protein EI94DRAFT_1739333 [Lactarius quietus]|nr:hypothetical protein EI94DRAFT_1739333 [Lactarius quietus]
MAAKQRKYLETMPWHLPPSLQPQHYQLGVQPYPQASRRSTHTPSAVPCQRPTWYSDQGGSTEGSGRPGFTPRLRCTHGRDRCVLWQDSLKLLATKNTARTSGTSSQPLGGKYSRLPRPTATSLTRGGFTPDNCTNLTALYLSAKAAGIGRRDA